MARNKWEAMLSGYQRMPALELLLVQPVSLTIQLEKVISHPRKKAICSLCSEEINNEREVWRSGEILCRPCGGQSYYRVQPQESQRLSVALDNSEKLHEPSVAIL
jgi:formylmethanofuran dehydrogenase subunit E